MKHTVNTPCVICASSSSTLLHEIAYPQYGYPGLFAIRQCSGCGLLFNSPRLSDPEIVDLYDGNYYVFREREPHAVSRVAQLLQRTAGVAQGLTKSRQLLEVGSAKGYMLALLREQGWQVEGVELSREAAEISRKRFGLKVYTGTLEDYVSRPGHQPAPVVLTTDVIEHVLDLDAFVQALFRATAPGGLAVIGTPNADSAHRQALGARWLGFNPFHIYLLSRGTLGTLLERHGFKVELAYTYTNDDAPAPWADSALRAALKSALSATGLIDALRWSKQTAAAAVDAVMNPPQRLLSSATSGLLSGPAYFESDDGRHARRQSCEGDNLVVIARRPQGGKDD